MRLTAASEMGLGLVTADTNNTTVSAAVGAGEEQDGLVHVIYPASFFLSPPTTTSISLSLPATSFTY